MPARCRNGWVVAALKAEGLWASRWSVNFVIFICCDLDGRSGPVFTCDLVRTL